MNKINYFSTVLCTALLWAVACDNPHSAKPNPPGGGQGKPPKPVAQVNPFESPETLARMFHKSLSANDAIQMMHLSMLGAPTNSWMEFTGKMYQHSSKLMTQNLADLKAANPREQRTEAEQARIFNLMAQRRQMDIAFTNSLQRLSVELPHIAQR